MRGVLHRGGGSRQTVVRADSNDDVITTEVQRCAFLIRTGCAIGVSQDLVRAKQVC